LIVLGFALLGCFPQRTHNSRLRIVNSGSQTINDLIVVFPHDRILFGEVSPGDTTEYRNVPGGVYRYAAYEFIFNGRTMTQPVTDWLGEYPINGNSFTYTMDLNPDRERTGSLIRLNNVNMDK